MLLNTHMFLCKFNIIIIQKAIEISKIMKVRVVLFEIQTIADKNTLEFSFHVFFFSRFFIHSTATQTIDFATFIVFSKKSFNSTSKMMSKLVLRLLSLGSNSQTKIDEMINTKQTNKQHKNRSTVYYRFYTLIY